MPPCPQDRLTHATTCGGVWRGLLSCSRSHQRLLCRAGTWCPCVQSWLEQAGMQPWDPQPPWRSGVEVHPRGPRRKGPQVPTWHSRALVCHLLRVTLCVGRSEPRFCLFFILFVAIPHGCAASQCPFRTVLLAPEGHGARLAQAAGGSRRGAVGLPPVAPFPQRSPCTPEFLPPVCTKVTGHIPQL